MSRRGVGGVDRQISAAANPHYQSGLLAHRPARPAGALVEEKLPIIPAPLSLSLSFSIFVLHLHIVTDSRLHRVEL